MSVQHQLIVKIFIIHTNDLHGQIDPKVQELAYLTTYYKQHGDILLDAGDASQGLPINNISEGAEMGCLMSEMGYNAMTIGNHEFDYTLNHVIDPNQDGFFKSSTAITKLASNVYYEGTENNVFELSKIEMIKGIQFSMFGLATPETKTKADPHTVAVLNLEIQLMH